MANQPITKGEYPGLCPRCKGAPRMVSKGGWVYGYCRQCQRDWRELYRSTKPCARCGKGKRAVSRSGRQYSYCRECRNILCRK